MDQVLPERIVFKKAISIFAVRFIFWEFLIAIIYLILRLLINYYKLDNPDAYFTFILSSLLPIVFTFIETTIAIYMIAKWMSESYIIKPGSVILKNGIVHQEEREYSLSSVQSVSSQQSLLGRIFGYGTVKLFSPALQQDLFFEEVSNPQNFTELIKTAVPGEGHKFGVIIRR